MEQSLKSNARRVTPPPPGAPAGAPSPSSGYGGGLPLWPTRADLVTAALVTAYLGAIVAANTAVAAYGARALPFTAFLLIPFDLCARDVLHERWGGRRLALKMAALVSAGSTLSYLISPASGRVALASALAFGVAASADALAYHSARDAGRLVRMNFSNLCGAVADSVVFPVVAFGSTTLWLTGAQAGAKVAGGLLWSLLFVEAMRRARWRRAVGYSRKGAH